MKPVFREKAAPWWAAFLFLPTTLDLTHLPKTCLKSCFIKSIDGKVLLNL